MDTSQEYIALCLHTEKLQENWVSEVGDYVCKKGSRKTLIITTKLKSGEFLLKQDDDTILHLLEVKREDYIWLPRQDQLQRIIFGINSDATGMMKFVEWADDQWGVDGKIVHSWEWLLLNYYKKNHTK